MPRADLHTYLEDHLAGARMALEVLAQLRDHAHDKPLRLIAGELEAEISSERDMLEKLVQQFGGDTNLLKDASAWIAEKVTRFKFGSFDDTSTSLQLYEAVEFLCLGILGKASLWAALDAASEIAVELRKADYPALRSQSEQQHARLEAHRIRLARQVLV